jgi:hypothetical protein
MNLGRAFTFAFDDPDWLGKLVIVAVLTAAAVFLMPLLLLGLVPLCVLLGYMLEIVNNVRDSKQIVLPRWDDYSDRMRRGAGVLLALFVYNLPLILISCCLFTVPGAVGDRMVDGFVTLVSLCCLLPLAIIWIGFSWPLLAAGMARYSRGGSSGVFFEVGRLFGIVNELGGYSIQLLLCAAIVNLLLIVFMAIPCLGWAIGLMLAVPILGHLVGQYARLMDNRDKKRRPVPRPRKA